MEAPGIENDHGRAAGTIEHERGSIGVRAASASASDRASECAIDRGDVTESSGGTSCRTRSRWRWRGPWFLAAEAKRWDVVVAVAEELRRRQRTQPSITARLSRTVTPSNKTSRGELAELRSRTAGSAAEVRAAQQLLDQPLLLVGGSQKSTQWHAAHRCRKLSGARVRPRA